MRFDQQLNRRSDEGIDQKEDLQKWGARVGRERGQARVSSISAWIHLWPSLCSQTLSGMPALIFWSLDLCVAFSLLLNS